MNMNNIIAAAFSLGLSAAAVAAEPALDTFICHRGESHDAPENTLPAYKMAVDRGFGFECDIYLSKDGRVFTFHDGTLTRTSGGKNTNTCNNATWDEVSRLDVGSWGKWKGSKFAGARPALFEEVLELARDGRWIYVDVKAKTGDIVPYVKAILEKQTKANPGNTLFLCGSVECGKAFKSLLPEYKVLSCVNCFRSWKKGAPPMPVEEIIAMTREMGADGVDIRYMSKVTTPQYMKAIKDAGLELHVWTVDSLPDAVEAFKRGAQTVTTNCAKKLLDQYSAFAAAQGASQRRAVQEENIPDATTGEMPADAVSAKMERAVDPALWADWRRSHPAPFWLFGEERRFAVRNDIVPAHWFGKGSEAAEIFRGRAQLGEWYAFQVCVASDKARELAWDAKTELAVTRITPRECRVAAGGVKPIWVMVDIPKDAASKTFIGEVAVRDAKTGESAALPFEIFADGPVLEDGGVSDAWRLARLKWLNSDIGREDTVTKPYTPVVIDKARRAVKILGRELVLGEDGLPSQIVSHFSGSNTRIVEKGMNLLAAPAAFRETAKPAAASRFAFTEATPARAAWKAETALDGGVVRIVEGRIDFAGECRFRIRHSGGRVPAASLEISMPADVARFRECFGINGGFFPEGKVEQKWNANLNRDAAWMGSVNGGIAVRFKGANYRRPLINAYYAWQKLRLPESWASGGGAMTLEKTAGAATLRAEGKDAPEGAEWNFDLYITPFHTLDMKAHLGDRYWHFGQRKGSFDAAAVRQAGATVVNLHHNTVWNPYINYPYNDDSGPLLKKVVKEAHAEGLMLKIYYTTRELTQNLPEFFALKSLDGEALLKRDASVPGWPITNRSGPHPWLRAHVGLDIIPAWRENVRFPQAYPPRLDLAVITTPDTRWDNFYLEGLDYLVREYGIDGLYIDDTALTGESMQRARRILGRDGKRRLVDNHSWNHHNHHAGSGSTNLAFIDLYPYFDLLWRGEGFSNNTPSDFWLVERSGIPFGLPGEMLGKGDPFKGLVFGMTDRMGWGSRKGSPQCMWKFFDETGLGDMEFVGWWDDACPVRIADGGEIKASVWKGAGKTVLAVANFSGRPQKAVFSFDGGAAKWERPAIAHVQTAGPAPDFSRPVEVPANDGFILVAREGER